jgi:dTDP-glucose pyrophosphorylase
MLLDKNNLKKIIISQESTILDAINNLNQSQLKIVLIVDQNKKFIGVVNDGDIRRALSRGYNVNSSIGHSINKKPFFVKNTLDLNNLNSRKLNEIFHIPIIKNTKIRGLYIRNINTNIIKKNIIKDNVVIMAGGYGKRLGLLTKKCPKALLKYNNKPLLQHILEQVKKNNFYNIKISVFFLSKMIKNFIYKNNSYSLKIKFIEEKKPLGTIGSIKLIKKISTNFIVMNCDIISDINLVEFLKFHKKSKSLLTIATKQFQYKNPYGVIVSHNNKFISFKEKPEIDFLINTGIYAFNKKVITIMKRLNISNIEDLIITLKNKKHKVLTYPLIENWRDFGSDKKNLKKFNF